MTPLPVILCGKSTDVGLAVMKKLSPEYEVVHFISDVSAATKIIPALLSGKPAPATPAGEDDNIGTKNYATPPVSVIIGRKFNDNDVNVMQDACYSGGVWKKECKPVVWLRSNGGKTAPSWGTPSFGEVVGGWAKQRLRGLDLEKGFEGNDGSMVLYY